MTPAEQRFYEWLHASPKFQGDFMPRTREIFMAGWDARSAYMLEPDDPPEVDPEDAEAQRIAETYADAADEYRAIEAGELP